jgi:8-oxo-dGTP pyrophosphatase MutT (NUDIX family)
MQIKEIKEVFGTKWLSLNEATYLSKEEKEMKWNFVSRKGDPKIVTAICRSQNTGKYLLISQPRVPVNKIVIEFPAGLIDSGESIQKAGLRELKEETGYDGQVISEGPFVVKSAGLSDEVTAAIELEVDENAVGKTEMESTEDIQAFWVTLTEFLEMEKKLDPTKFIIDGQVWFYFHGLNNIKKAKARSSAKKAPVKKAPVKKAPAKKAPIKKPPSKKK